MQKTTDIAASFWPRFTEISLDRMAIPTKHRKTITDSIQVIQYTSSDSWNDNNMNFDKDAGGQMGLISIMGNQKKTKNVSVMIFTIDNTFKLAPNVYIMEDYLSVAGGIFESKKDKFKSETRALTQADISALQKASFLLAFKGFADALKIIAQIPK